METTPTLKAKIKIKIRTTKDNRF